MNFIDKIKKSRLLHSNRFYWLIALLLLVALKFSYSSFIHHTRTLDYKIFDFSKTVSWEENKSGIYRTFVKENLDMSLMSTDNWREFESKFFLIYPHQCGFIFQYQDKDNYRFLWLDTNLQSISLAEMNHGVFKQLKELPLALKNSYFFSVKFIDKKLKLAIDHKPLFDYPLPATPGKIGLVIKEVRRPLTFFYQFHIQGILKSGHTIKAQSLSHFTSLNRRFTSSLILFYVLVLSFGIYLALGTLYQPQLSQFLKYRSNVQIRWIKPWSIGLTHLALTACIFWPFLSRGEILIGSSDNIWEIYPLFVYSKHNFLQWIHGNPMSLWNPYFLNGIPFFSNHWHMVYYPFNWPLFFVPDKFFFQALTWRTFFEVFLVGLCAYGFFIRELKNRPWALFCSIVYQLCSFLIFAFTIFPCTSLYFAITFYLYWLWSIPERKALSNYVVLTLACYLILTSANLAFIFYAVLSLVAISLYRFFNTGTQRKKTFGLVAGAWLTAGLITVVRLVPCFFGIRASNRIIENYYTLHDRFFLIIRLFLPEISGWMGDNTFNVLGSQNLGLIFNSIKLPFNSQIAFFVYFGILPAVLLTASLLIRTQGSHTFWKVYTIVTLAIALLWQPLWGILSILFFPMNHYYYHMIILPIGICTLVGYTGIFIEKSSFPHKKLGRRLTIALMLVQCYILIFLTYLSPRLTNFTRTSFVLFLMGTGVYFVLKHYRPKLLKSYLFSLSGFLSALLGILFLVVSTLVILRPLPHKGNLAVTWIIPFFTGLIVLTIILTIYSLAKSQYAKKSHWLLLLLLAVIVPVASTLVTSLPAFIQLVNIQRATLDYIIDILLGHIKIFLIVQIIFLVFALVRAKLLSRQSLMTILIALVALDLVIFNLRSNHIAAPSLINKAFSGKKISYLRIDKKLQSKMDLVNYRTTSLHKASFQGNTNVLSFIPSYTGIVGYMPKRFSVFISQFGFPKDLIVLYAADASNNQRFLDLCAVRYELLSKTSFKERPTSLARLNFFYNYKVIDDDKQLLQRLKDDSFDPLGTVLLSEELPSKSYRPNGKRSGHIPIEKASTDEIIAHVQTDSPGVILFDETYDKGWKAYVDEVPTAIVRANYNFMACFVDQGLHKIVFRYEPLSYYWSVRVSLFGLMVFMTVILIGFLKHLKKPKITTNSIS